MQNGSGKSAKFDISGLRAALAKSAGVAAVSRPALGRLIGAHPNSIALWEGGKPVGSRFLEKLRELDTKLTSGEKVGLPERKTRGRAKKAAAKTARGPGRKPGRPRKSSTGSYDVKGLRTKLGASRVALAKLLGVSAGSILNWETGKSITEKNIARLKELASRAESGGLSLPMRRKPGRPTRGAAAAGPAPRRGRPPASVAIAPSSVAPLYANVIRVQRGRRDALIRLALSNPGESARVVADVFVPLEALADLR